MSVDSAKPAVAGNARRRLAKRGVLWLTRRIGKLALIGDWQSASDAAASRDRLLLSVHGVDAGIDAMRAAADEARSVLADPESRSHS
jgi:hypothetical protein